MIAGRYSLDREIGRGGMGAVWLGHDEVLGRTVALKRIGMLPGADRTDLARARREAQLGARLNHPHVVAVFNLVEDDTGAHWLVMEYVEGTTLGRLVKEEGALPPDEAAPLLAQVADALVAAHDAGIVHRDVKPSNILVGVERRVKLADFGIARIAGDPALTQSGLITGSPAYLAPEVAAGERGDEAADVWSVGATAYHVLSGRPPYDIGEHVVGGLYKIVNDDPPRLADAGWLAPLLEGTMTKDPARRWSMREVRDFLRSGPPTRALPLAAPPERGRRRVPVGAVLVGLALAAVLALGIFLTTRGSGGGTAAAGKSPSASASASASSSPSARPSSSASASRSPSASPSPSPSTKPKPKPTPKPTAAGMTSFVRRYVSAVSTDPDTAWTMLTPRFQRESGGLGTYRRFWGPVGAAHLLDVSADPRSLVVSYHVRFDHFGNGRRPTVLDLVFNDGRYRIDGEHSQGFTPAA